MVELIKQTLSKIGIFLLVNIKVALFIGVAFVIYLVYLLIARKSLSKLKIRFFNFYPFDLYFPNAKEWSVVNMLVILALLVIFGYLIINFNFNLQPA